MAGRGDDIIYGNGGVDVLQGGGGNDTIVVNADNVSKFTSQGQRWDGGADGGGINTLRVADGVAATLDLTQAFVGTNLGAHINNIQRIDLVGGTGGHTLRFDIRSILDTSRMGVFRDGVSDSVSGVGGTAGAWSGLGSLVARKQWVIDGGAEDTLDFIPFLDNAAGGGGLVGAWVYGGTAALAGKSYDIWNFSGSDVQLLVDPAIQLAYNGVSGNGLNPPNAQAGGNGSDVLVGGAGDDRLFGGGGADILTGGEGNNFLSGGPQTVFHPRGDIVSWQWITATGAAAGISATLADNGSAIVTRGAGTGAAGVDTLVGIEGLWGGAGDDVLVGNIQDNWLIGGDGNNVLNGGDASVYGDTASWEWITNVGAAAGVSVTLSAAGGATVVRSGGAAANGSGTDTLLSIENLRGGMGNDTLVGNALSNTFFMGWGNDIVNPGGGRDTLDYSGITDSATSVVAWAPNAAFSVVRSGGTFAGSDSVTAAGIWTLIGGAGNDVLGFTNSAYGAFNNGFHNLLAGGAGDDVLVGGGGMDRLLGEDGNDLLIVNANNVANLAANSIPPIGPNGEAEFTTYWDGGAGLNTLRVQDTAAVTLDLERGSTEQSILMSVANIATVDLMSASTANTFFTGGASANGANNGNHTLLLNVQSLIDIGGLGVFNASNGWGDGGNDIAGHIAGKAVHQLVIDGDAGDTVDMRTLVGLSGAWTKAGSVTNDSTGTSQTYDVWNFTATADGTQAVANVQVIIDADIARQRNSVNVSAGVW